MKMSLRFAALFLFNVAAAVFPVTAEPDAGSPAATTATREGPQAEIEAIVARVGARIDAGARDAQGLAEELAAFDALEKKYAGQKTNEVAGILVAKAQVHIQVLRDEAGGAAVLLRVLGEFPDTEYAKTLKPMEEQLLAAVEHGRKLAALVGGPAPGIDFDWATRDGLRSLADLKGRVVVLDFWATWCGPCVASFPEVGKLAGHYAGLDVEIVGVTSIQGYVVGADNKRVNVKGNPAAETKLIDQYVRERSMNWTVAISRQPVFNPDYGIEGIPSMVIIAPDGTVRHTGLHPAEPLETKTRRIDAILKEFGKKTGPAI